MASEPLTDDQVTDLLKGAGYDPAVDAGVTDPEPAPQPVEKKPRKKKQAKATPEPTPDGPTAYSPMRDNDWQNAEFQARKATRKTHPDDMERQDYNKRLWEALGHDRNVWNKAVRAAQRTLSSTGDMREVITNERDIREAMMAPEQNLLTILAAYTPEAIAQALAELSRKDSDAG